MTKRRRSVLPEQAPDRCPVVAHADVAAMGAWLLSLPRNAVSDAKTLMTGFGAAQRLL
jgi:hypothetical protein